MSIMPSMYCLGGQTASINSEISSTNEGRIVACKENGRLGNILRLRLAAQRYSFGETSPLLGGIGNPAELLQQRRGATDGTN